MGAQQKGRFWRTCRVCFRWFRISVWLLILAALASLLYVNQVGLPHFVKDPLLDKLRERGVDLQFSRLRLRWDEGIVAENVHFGPADQKNLTPRFNVAEVQVRLNWNALAHRQVQVDSLMLRQGHISWTFAETNRLSQNLSVANIQTELSFLPDDKWALDHFKAQFAGANIQLTGILTNASAARNWAIFQGQEPISQSAELWQLRLRHLDDVLQHIHFSTPPELTIFVRGDALDLHTFNVLLSLSAPDADTPWGTLSRGRFAARLFSADTNGISRGELDLHADTAQSRWGSITNFALSATLTTSEAQTNIVIGALKLSAANVLSPWAEGSNTLVIADWVHSMTNPIPVLVRGTIQSEFVHTTWGSATELQLRADLKLPQEPAPVLSVEGPWSWWTNLAPYQLGWDCRLGRLNTDKFAAESLSLAGDWQSPRLVVTNLQASLFHGRLAGNADVDVTTRAVHLSFASDMDPHLFAPLLPEGAQTQIQQFSWSNAPAVTGLLSVILPATNKPPALWRAEALPTLKLEGEIALNGSASYRHFQVDSAHCVFLYSNQYWRVPDFTLIRPEGRLISEHQFDETTGQFHCHVSSTIDPRILRPFLGENLQPGFDLFTLTRPPELEFDIWGRTDDRERMGVRGQVSVTNFTFRGESFSWLETRVLYTNRNARFIGPRLELGSQLVQADGLMLDLGAQLLYVTNGFSTAEPMVIARAIGPNIVKAIEDYQFGTPPTAHVYGTIPLHGEEDADLHFDIKGGPFHWWKFNLPHVTGHVHWAGLHLGLTNVQADFYHGLAAGWAEFSFPRERPTEFQFGLAATNVLLPSLVSDLASTTNHLDGRLYGNLTVTKANTDNWQTVFGYGEAHMRDGLLWDIPLFGKFSPVLNGIAPGLGNSRASAATASFVITNGVIRTEDLEIRSSGMRLRYRGNVNLENQLNARVDAELLRDMWLVGPLVSTVFWPVTKLFEYRVTGTLADPKTEPVFILPKIMLLPFHPVRTLKGLMPEDPNNNPNFSPLPP